MIELRSATLFRLMLTVWIFLGAQEDAAARPTTRNTSSTSAPSPTNGTDICTAPTMTLSYVSPQSGTDVNQGAMDQADWPYSPWNPPLISQRVRAILRAGNDGTRRVQISPVQVGLWVAETNQVLQASGIRLLFDPAELSGDWEELNSTLLNTMTGTAHPNWAQQKELGNQIAAQTAQLAVDDTHG